MVQGGRPAWVMSVVATTCHRRNGSSRRRSG